MNKIVAGLVAVLMSFAVFADQKDDLLLTFSTVGPDTYSDGFRVRDGEFYAVIWTAKGETFGGLKVDGTPNKETDKIVVAAPLAKEARCPLTVVEIDGTVAEQEYKNGTFGLYLLDTRVKDESGKTVLSKDENGLPEAVNAVAKAAEKPAAGDGKIAATSRVRLGDVGVYTVIPSPVITVIRIENATVTLKVKDMCPAATYFVVPTSLTPGEPAPALDVKPEGDTFVFPQPADADSSMFKIIGTRNF